MYLFLMLIAAVIVVKIVKIQKFSDAINTNSQPRYFNVKAHRGNIIADDGSLLAISMPLYDVRLDMSVIKEDIFNDNLDELAISLSNLFKDKTSSEYKIFLINSKKLKRNKYVLLQNKVTHNQLNALKKMPILKSGQNKGGLIAEQRPNREKPFGLLAQRTVGVLRGVNPVGIERAFNQVLSGVDGKHLKRKIAKGIWVPQDDKRNLLPKSGNDIITTINTDMQDVAQKALEKSLINHDADWGCVVLMEVTTGKVKVIANLKKKNDGSVEESFNYAMAKHVSPGSTFKLASVIAGLEDGFFSIEDSIKTYGGKFSFYDRVMKDSQLDRYDKITIKEAFIRSSNVGISRTIFDNYKNNPTAFTDRIYKMGLSTSLKLELPYPDNLKSPVPHKGGWSGVTLPWMSIGYEMQLTPIHMLTFYNAIANKGRMTTPIFTSAVSSNGIVVEERFSEVINPAICSQATIDEVIPLLIGVVEEGTAQNIKSKDFLIAGKTGTTVINFSNRAAEDKKKYQASFIGFFPAKKPKYSCVVVINNPKINGHYGGVVAAPIFKEIADKVYASDIDIHIPINQVEDISSLPKVKQGSTIDANIVLDQLEINTFSTNNNWMVSKTTKDTVFLLLRKVEEDLRNRTIPDLRGMGLKDALYLLETYGLVVESVGNGSVFRQSISKGNTFKVGTKIKLELV